MRLSIVIVNWNTRELILRCLTSIYTHAPDFEFEVWVVDNHSSDDSAANIQTRFPQVHLIENNENLGFATANNQAIREASGVYIMLLNPDTEVLSNAIEELVQFMESSPQAGAAGPLISNPDGTLQSSCFPFPTLSNEFWRLFHLDGLWPLAHYPIAAWDRQQSREVEVLLGACILLRRDALEQVDLLDESFYMYSEEIDLCYRLMKTGWTIHWIPQASIIHLGGQSTLQAQAQMFMHLYESKLHFFRKHYGHRPTETYKIVLVLASLARIGIGRVLGYFPGRFSEKYRTITERYQSLLRALPHL